MNDNSLYKKQSPLFDPNLTYFYEENIGLYTNNSEKNRYIEYTLPKDIKYIGYMRFDMTHSTSVNHRYHIYLENRDGKKLTIHYGQIDSDSKCQFHVYTNTSLLAPLRNNFMYTANSLPYFTSYNQFGGQPTIPIPLFFDPVKLVIFDTDTVADNGDRLITMHLQYVSKNTNNRMYVINTDVQNELSVQLLSETDEAILSTAANMEYLVALQELEMENS